MTGNCLGSLQTSIDGVHLYTGPVPAVSVLVFGFRLYICCTPFIMALAQHMVQIALEQVICDPAAGDATPERPGEVRELVKVPRDNSAADGGEQQ